ncbi:energy transducer TonB [Spirosoma pollinicola]|nr:energy transducer TonB [Spirosoma pollinicola]
MKTIPLVMAYATVLSTLANAQVIGPVLVDNGKPVMDVQSMFESVPSGQVFNEFATLSNEPFFPGGKQALQQHLSNLELYPAQARLTLNEGTVRVQFRVKPSGLITDIRVVQSRGALLDLAAVKAVSIMPRWYPAHRSGVAVSHLVELPITFRLD